MPGIHCYTFYPLDRITSLGCTSPSSAPSANSLPGSVTVLSSEYFHHPKTAAPPCSHSHSLHLPFQESGKEEHPLPSPAAEAGTHQEIQEAATSQAAAFQESVVFGQHQ